jgi:hypothetical protein
MSDSDDRFNAVRSTGEQLVQHRERIASLRGDVGKLDERLDDTEKGVGRILGEMSELRQGFAMLNQKLNPILDQYWHEHPSKAHTPSSAPPARKSAIAGLAQNPVTQMGAIFLALQIIAELVRVLIATPAISMPKIQPAPAAVVAPAAK